MASRLLHRVSMALRSFVCRRTVDRELDDELRFHLEELEELAASRGDDPSTARRVARRQMGSINHVKEACRDMRTLPPVEQLLRDLRFGARLLARSPGFTAVAVLSLALGIGSSSAIFSLINAIVLRPLPIADSQELYIAQTIVPSGVEPQFSYPVVERAVALLRGTADVAAQSSTESVLIATRGGGAANPPEAARLQLVAGDFWAALRQRAQIGRLFGPDDNRPLGQHAVAVISDRYWSRKFARTPGVLGGELIINGTSITVVGVAGAEFFGTTIATETPDVWAPAAMQAALRFAGDFNRTGGDLQKPWTSQPEIQWLHVMIRAPKGAHQRADEAMTLALDRQSPPVEGQDDGPARVTLLPGSRGFSPVRSELTTPLIVLLLAVGLLLAIACANIASLLLARGTSRSHEMAVRLSIGAGRGMLIRQLLTESLLLAFLGGALGLAFAHWGSTALLTFLTRGPVTDIDVAPDWRVIGLTFATCIVTAVAFGLFPAVRGTRVPLTESLKAKTRSVVGADAHNRRVPVGKLLVAGQMAVAIVLLLVAVLFVRSLQALGQVDVGYDKDHVLVARIDPRSSGYTVAELPTLYARVVGRLTRLPGVVGASVAASGPFSGSRNRGDFVIEGYTPKDDEQMVTVKDWVTSDYFRTVGLAITQGRGIGQEDSAHGRRVCVISEALSRRYFPNQSPIGRRVSWGGSNFDADGLEIVGVVEDARYNDVRAESLNMVYMPATLEQR